MCFALVSRKDSRMRSVVVVASLAMLSAGLAAGRGFVDKSTARDQRQGPDTLAEIELVLNPNVDLQAYHARPVGWVMGQLCGVETPSLAPSPKANYRRLAPQ